MTHFLLIMEVIIYKSSMFLNPNENDCKLNYFFKENNKIQLENFLKYKKFEFKHSKFKKFLI